MPATPDAFLKHAQVGGVLIGILARRGRIGWRRGHRFSLMERDEILLNLATLCFFLTIHSVAPYLSQYAVELGASEGMVALLGPFFAFSAMAFRPLSGFLADRGWTKWLLVAGASISTAAQGIYMLSTGVSMLYAGRFIQGAAIAIFIPASFQAAAIGERDRVIRSLAWRNTITGVSFALGPALGGYVAQHLGYRSLFMVSTSSGLMASILALAIDCSRFSQEPRSSRKGREEGFAERGFLSALASLLLYSSSYSCMVLFLPAYHKENGLETSLIAVFFTAMAISSLISRILFTQVIGILSVEGTALAGVFLASMGYLAVSMNPLSEGIVYYGILTGLGAGLAIPSLQVIAITGIPQGRRGMASAIYTAMFDLGNLTGPAIAAIIAGNYREMIEVASYMNLATIAPLAILGIAKIRGTRSH